MRKPSKRKTAKRRGKMPPPSRPHIDKVRKSYERIWRDLLKEDVDA